MGKKQSVPEFLKVIGSRLGAIRRNESLSQSQMAKILGITGSAANVYVSQMETRGIPGPFLFSYISWASKKGYNMNWIMRDDNSGEPMKNPSGIKWQKIKELLQIINTDLNNLNTELGKPTEEL